MITNEMLQVVAEYDGWVKQPAARAGSFYYQKGDKIKICNNEDLPYATSMDWLHPVAMKVLGELGKTNVGIRYLVPIYISMLSKPINDQYIDLFNSVYEAILFINLNKK